MRNRISRLLLMNRINPTKDRKRKENLTNQIHRINTFRRTKTRNMNKTRKAVKNKAKNMKTSKCNSNKMTSKMIKITSNKQVMNPNT